MARVLVFDVNETLLDLSALREPFSRAFGDPAPMGEWFVRLLHGSLVATLTDTYDDFATIARRALEAVAKRKGRDLHVAERDTILGTMFELPARSEVPDALSRLRSAGFPLATLTNSSHEMVQAQLAHAGILELFDHVLSVDEVRRYKPAPEPYHLAAERLGASPPEVRMVAAHDWDVWGAIHAGCTAAYVARTDTPFMIGQPPDLVGADLSAVADAILDIDEPRR
ncbi:MAG TPA: haloacid dehalogenase type II [Actinomycetota bacterium]|nr:haloacid dehalogenase type II [Actinomycetota bacterium]